MARNGKKWYPAWVYHINEDVTRRNKAAYDKEQEQKIRRLLSFCPEYYELSLRERLEVNREFRKMEEER